MPWLVLFGVLTIVPVAAAGEPAGALLAYVGPGAGLGMLGSLLAVVAAIVIGLFGLVLYPITLIRKAMQKRHEENSAAGGVAEPAADPSRAGSN